MSMTLTQFETNRLVTELDALGTYEGWKFSYEYPGYFTFIHSQIPLTVYCTPDWECTDAIPVCVSTDDGDYLHEYDVQIPLLAADRSGQKILDLVRPTLDKLLAEHRAKAG